MCKIWSEFLITNNKTLFEMLPCKAAVGRNNPLGYYQVIVIHTDGGTLKLCVQKNMDA